MFFFNRYCRVNLHLNSLSIPTHTTGLPKLKIHIYKITHRCFIAKVAVFIYRYVPNYLNDITFHLVFKIAHILILSYKSTYYADNYIQS